MARIRRWGGWPLVLAIVASIAFVGILSLVYESHAHPNANEFCAGHGGVRNLDPGGFYTPSAATCNDGTAGRVWL